MARGLQAGVVMAKKSKKKKKKGKGKVKFGPGALVASGVAGEMVGNVLTELVHRGVEHYFGKGKKKQTVKRLDAAIKRMTSPRKSSTP